MMSEPIFNFNFAKSEIMDHFQIQAETEVKSLLAQRGYPCVAAVQSLHRNDFWLRTYTQFGKVHQRDSLREDLLQYLKKYKETRSQYFTFWTVFHDNDSYSEEEFEQFLWSELSALTSENSKETDQDPRFSLNPDSKNFCFSLGGSALFVVGLHSQSSRLARRFPWPSLVFNVYEQFDQLASQKKYIPMVETIRRRDIEFQGDVNPMALLHNDNWESIQFSGKKNSEDWKCPFHFRKTDESD